jgi:serine protease inhibitor
LAKREKEEEKLEKLVGKKKEKNNIREVSYSGRFFNGIWELMGKMRFRVD